MRVINLTTYIEKQRQDREVERLNRYIDALIDNDIKMKHEIWALEIKMQTIRDENAHLLALLKDLDVEIEK